MNAELTFRKVTADDSQLLYAWRNEKIVRMYSRNSRPLTLDEHNIWFNNVFLSNSDSRVIYIFEISSQRVGMTRIDKITENTAEISIILDPKFRKLGLSNKLLSMTLDIVIKKYSYQKIFATVHKDNIASNRAFKSLGFKEVDRSEFFITFQWLPNAEKNVSTV